MWYETLLSMNLDNPALQAIGIGIVRGIAGYLENVIERKEPFSITKFFATIFRVFPQALGLSAFGIPAAGAFVTDWGMSKITKIGKK